MKNNRQPEHGTSAPGPWKFDAASFAALQGGDRIAAILDEAREEHLFFTPVADDGRTFSQSLLIGRNAGIVQVDRPLDWDKTLSAFRLFFRRSNGLWFGFRVTDFDLNPFTLSFPQPAELCFLQRRQSPRVAMPNGTRAMLRKDGQFLNSFFVRDISVAGMLICTGSAASGIEVNARLRDIVISIPGQDSSPVRTLPPIDNGQVVRTFFEEENNTFCHGVSFRYESAYVREALRQLAPATGDKTDFPC
jgi:hypothetical protein